MHVDLLGCMYMWIELFTLHHNINSNGLIINIKYTCTWPAYFYYLKWDEHIVCQKALLATTNKPESSNQSEVQSGEYPVDEDDGDHDMVSAVMT